MPGTFRRFNFLNEIFPPAGSLPPQPGSVSDEISLVHQVLNGTDRLEEWRFFSAAGAAGVKFVISGQSAADKYWSTFGLETFHDDPVALDGWFSLVPDGSSPVAIQTSDRAIPTSIHFGCTRRIIIPPRTAVRVDFPALAAAQVIILRFQYLELVPGEPAPPGS